MSIFTRPSALGRRRTCLTFILLSAIAPATLAQTEYNLFTLGSQHTINGATFQQASTFLDAQIAAGTGNFRPFLRLQNNGTEAGHNTGGTLSNDEKSGPWTTNLRLAEVPVVGGNLEFFLDINETNPGRYLSLDQLKIYVSGTPNLTATAATLGTLGTLVYDMDAAPAGDSRVVLDYLLDSSGSGRSDMRLLVPRANFTVGCGTTRPCYIYLWTKFGEKATANSDDGFEEWNIFERILLGLSKTAVPSFTREVTWDIQKQVSPDAWTLFTGDSGTSDYTITLTKSVIEGSHQVSGVITINNPIASTKSFTLTDVADRILAVGPYPEVFATVNCGTLPAVIPLGGSKQCTYSVPLPDDADRTNRVNITFSDQTTSYLLTFDLAFSFAGVSPTLVGFDEVSLDDTIQGSLGTFGDSDTVTYDETFTCDDDEGNHPNTVTISETGQSANADVQVDCYAPTVSKTVETARTSTYNWTIEKSVTPASWDLFTGDSGTSEYTIDLSAEIVDSGFMVSGQITVKNPNPSREALLTSLADVLSGPINATIGSCTGDQDGTEGAPYEVAIGTDLVCDYSANVDDGSNRTNTATATLQNYAYDADGVGTEDGTTDFETTEDVSFAGAQVEKINETVNVVDDVATPGDDGDDLDFGPFDGDEGPFEFGYERTFACDGDEGEYTNTAEIVETGQSDDATVTVNCYALEVTKDATAQSSRSWSWDITKTVFTPNANPDPLADNSAENPLILTLGQSYVAGYTVEVTATLVSDQSSISGTILIYNPAPMAATINAVSDLISQTIAGDSSPAVECGVGFPYELASEGTLECSYSQDPAEPEDGTNTATATLQNYAYDAEGGSTEDGTTDFSGSAEFEFSFEETDECVDVDDTNASNAIDPPGNPFPDTFCAEQDGDSKEYTYYIRFLYESDEQCGNQGVLNTASFVTNDTGATGDATVAVQIRVDCEPNACTLTPGYWKTHNPTFPGGASKKADPAWLFLGDRDGDSTEEFELENFFKSGQTWYQVLWTQKAGNAYYNLAFHYIAAVLNQLNGATPPAAVQTAMTQAAALFNAYTPAQADALKGKNRKPFIDLAGILAGWIAEFHCDEDGLSSGSPLLLASRSNAAPAIATAAEAAQEAQAPETVQQAAPEAEADAEADAGEARIDAMVDLPTRFALEQNYPNPFNPVTAIRVQLPSAVHVSLSVYDVTGREVARLVDGTLDAGVHEVRWDAGAMPSGIYLYVVRAGDFMQSRSMVLLK